MFFPKVSQMRYLAPNQSTSILLVCALYGDYDKIVSGYKAL